MNPTWTWQAGSDQPDVYELCERPYDDQGNPIDTPFREPRCTTQNPAFDWPRGWRAVVCGFGPNTPGDYLAVPGHVDWQTATFTGPITWTGYNSADHDLNFFIQPPKGAAVFPPSDAGFEIEFKRDEVADQFVNGWWQTFRQKLGDGSGDPQIDHMPGVVVGLLGLDCDHDCGTELHPVYAMALNTNAGHWSLFARNWGNEGFCSSQDHLLDSAQNQIRLTIPWLPGATAATINNSAFYSAGPGLPAATATVVVGHGIVVTFTLLAPESHSLIYGDLDISWTGGVTTTAAALQPGPVRRPTSRQSVSVDDRIERVLRNSSDARRRFRGPERRASASRNETQTRVPLNLSSERVRPAQVPQARAVENKSNNDELESNFRAFCAATRYNPADAVLKLGCTAVRASSEIRRPKK